MKVGICASGSNDNFENQEHIKVLNEQHEVIVFHPKDVSFIFKRVRMQKYLSKIKNDSSIIANRAHCKEWVKEELTTELANFVFDSYKRPLYVTIMGLDVGMTEDGTFHMIEENYAPQWKPFQDAAGINVAEKILQ